MTSTDWTFSVMAVEVAVADIVWSCEPPPPVLLVLSVLLPAAADRTGCAAPFDAEFTSEIV